MIAATVIMMNGKSLPSWVDGLAVALVVFILVVAWFGRGPKKR